MSEVEHIAQDSFSDPLLGRTLEGYRFLSLLGRGGFGAVYLSQHPRLDLQVAVKYIRLDGNTDDLADSEYEIKILSSLKHRGVVQIYDAFRYQNYQLIMMEFVRGGSLSSHVQKLGKLDLAISLEAMIQVAEALSYIHNKGILHLDLKPGNILLDPQEDEHQPFPRFVLTDFGIARFVNPSGYVTLVGGTPAYMAPEQFGFGEEKPDRRADIYQFGVILYELLVGAVPFEARQYVEFAQKHAYETPIPPSQRVSILPAALDDIVMKALAKIPAERYQSIGEVARALISLRSTLTPGSQTSEMPQKLAQAVKAQADHARNFSVVQPRRGLEPTVPDSPPHLDLLVMRPDGSQTPVSFNNSPIIVGRSKEVDLTLEHRTISRRHARIDFESGGRVFVTDLESSHGTYMDATRLNAGERTAWTGKKNLLIEGFVMQIAGQGAATVYLPASSIKTNEVKVLLDNLQAQVKQPHVNVSVSPKVVYVEMGKPQPLWVTVRPDDAPSARYEVRVSPGPGIDARWYTISAPKTIASGVTETFEVVIAAPGMDVIGGNKYEMILEVVADNPAIPPALQVVKLSVVPFMRFNIALNPGEVTHRRRRRAGLIITNNGNYAETFAIQLQAPDRLSIRPKKNEIELKPGQYKNIPLRFNPARDAFKEDRLLFTVSVNAKSGMTEKANGSYILPRGRSIPLLPILFVALVIAVLINWLVFNQPPAAQLEYFTQQVNNFVASAREIIGQ